VKFFLILFFTFISTVVFSNPALVVAQSEIALNLYLPSIQLRYEDNADQSRSLKNGYSINLATEIQKKYLVGVEYNIQSEKTGNASLSITHDFAELNLVAGYIMINWTLAENNSVHFFGLGYLGQNKNKIKTELLGNITTDVSMAELSYGVGILGQLKLNFILIEVDTRWMSSKSYVPESISVTDLRFGFQWPI